LDAIKVLLGTLPRLLSGIVSEAVREQPDMLIVDERDNSELADVLEQQDVDVVVTALESDELMALGASTFEIKPRLAILALTEGAHAISLCELRPAVVPLFEVSRQSLIDAIRIATSRRKAAR